MHKEIRGLLFDLQSDIEEVRKGAIIWLAQVGDEAVLPDLRRMTQDPSTSIRYFARRAIDTIEKRLRGASGPALPATPAPRFQVDDWRARLAAAEPAARLSAAQALARLDQTQARPLARERLAVELEPAVQAALLALFAPYQNEEDLPLIFAQLGNPDAGVRAQAVAVLEAFYHPSIRDRLLPMVRDPDNRTRANVLLVLGRYDEDLIAGPLAEMATSSEIWNKDSALFVLKRLRTPRAVELLGRMHTASRGDGYLFPKVDSALRELADKGDEAAAKVLASLEAGRFEHVEGKLELDRVLDDIESETEGSERRVKRSAIATVADFESALADADYERRLSAVDAGGTLDPVIAAMAFRQRLAVEQHPFVISKLIKELGRVGGPADLELIAAQLTHPDARVRSNAVEGLALLGGEQAYERIKPLMEDAAPRVQGAAAKVIYGIDRDRAFRKLRQMIASREGAVSDAAVHALGEVHSDDVLELLELALGQDDQELKLKMFRVLQRLAAKNPVVAQIYERYREEGDGVLLREGDLAHTVGVAVDPGAEGRLQAVEVLRKSPDPRAEAALEKLSRDRDARVKRAAMGALRVRDLERERGVMLYQLGSVLYRAWKRDELENRELDEAFQAVEREGQALDQRGDMLEVLARRGLAMSEAGRRGLDLVNDFQIKHRVRGPRSGEELTVDGLPALAARIATVDRKIEERLRSLDEELVRSPEGPLPPVEARPASGKVAAASDPAVSPDLPAARPPKANRAPRVPSGSLTAPIDVPAADGALVQLKSWLQQNPAALAIAGTVALVVTLVSMTGSLTGAASHGAWTRQLKDPVKLVAGTDTVLALSGSGALTCLGLATGKVEWQYSGPPLEAPNPPRADGQIVVLSAPDGHLVGVSQHSGKKAWDAAPGALASPPVLAAGRLVMLLKEPPTVVVLDARNGQKLAARSVSADVEAVTPALGGMLLVRRKGLSLMDANLTRAEWEAVLPSESVPEVLPFELAGNLVIECKDLLLCLSRDGSRVWDRRIEPGALVMPGAPGANELFVIAKKFVEVVDAAGKGGASATVGRAWTVVEVGRGDALFADEAGVVYLLDLRDKTQRRVLDLKEPVRALLRVGNVGLAAAGERIEAYTLAAPKS